MNKRGWFIPILIVSVNALAIVLQWAFLPESLPAHFDLDGNASGEMSRSALLLYPLLCIGHSHFGNYACFHVGGAGDPACCNCRFCRQHNQIPLQ